eukprot:675491-Pleurochrysis_carterae.AAC.2
MYDSVHAIALPTVPPTVPPTVLPTLLPTLVPTLPPTMLAAPRAQRVDAARGREAATLGAKHRFDELRQKHTQPRQQLSQPRQRPSARALLRPRQQPRQQHLRSTVAQIR